MYVNDVIINFVRLYISSQVQFTYIVDPLTVEKIFKDGPTSITRKVVPPGMKKILLPVIESLAIGICWQLRLKGKYLVNLTLKISQNARGQ